MFVHLEEYNTSAGPGAGGGGGGAITDSVLFDLVRHISDFVVRIFCKCFPAFDRFGGDQAATFQCLSTQFQALYRQQNPIADLNGLRRRHWRKI